MDIFENNKSKYCTESLFSDGIDVKEFVKCINIGNEYIDDSSVLNFMFFFENYKAKDLLFFEVFNDLINKINKNPTPLLLSMLIKYLKDFNDDRVIKINRLLKSLKNIINLYPNYIIEVISCFPIYDILEESVFELLIRLMKDHFCEEIYEIIKKILLYLDELNILKSYNLMNQFNYIPFHDKLRLYVDCKIDMELCDEIINYLKNNNNENIVKNIVFYLNDKQIFLADIMHRIPSYSRDMQLKILNYLKNMIIKGKVPKDFFDDDNIKNNLFELSQINYQFKNLIISILYIELSINYHDFSTNQIELLVEYLIDFDYISNDDFSESICHYIDLAIKKIS